MLQHSVIEEKEGMEERSEGGKEGGKNEFTCFRVKLEAKWSPK